MKILYKTKFIFINKLKTQNNKSKSLNSFNV